MMQFFSEECAADSSNDSPSRFECKRAARFMVAEPKGLIAVL